MEKERANEIETQNLQELETLEVVRGLSPASGPNQQLAQSGRLGRFELEEELGRGAFGIVYRARDPQLERTIALKLPQLKGGSSDNRILRFLREAKAAGNLHHPNIVAVHDAGQIDGVYYIASAYIKGCALREMLKRQGKPSQTAAARLIARLADALGYAHRAGVIHRDIKPENILLSEEGIPFIADFGLARMQATDVLQTRDGVLLGTPAYMSPEQAEGRLQQVDGRSDLWALGVILYELLCGCRPFEGGELQLLYAIRHEEPVSLRSVDPHIDRDLATICEKCLRKDADQRYPTCDDLRDDLEKWLSDEAISARRPALWERLSRWHRRNPSLARVTVSFLMTLIVGTLAVTALWLRASWHRQNAENSALAALRQQQVAEERLQQNLMQAQQLQEQAEQLQQEKTALEDAKQEIETQLTELQNQERELQSSSAAKLLAEEEARVEATLRSVEQNKNLNLRYFGDIYAARLALRAGDSNQCKALLQSANPSMRSIEYRILSDLARYSSEYQTFADVRQFPPQLRDFFLSAHTPLELTGSKTLGLLTSVSNAKSISRDGQYALTAGPQFDWLAQQFTEGRQAFYKTLILQTRASASCSTTILTHIASNSIRHEDIAIQSWLSPDRTCVVFSRPYSQWSNRPDEDTTTLAVGLDLIVHKIDQTEGEVEYLLKRERLGNISFRISNPTLVKYQLAPWPTYAGCFTDASQVFSTLESATQTIINWDLQASQSSQLASRQVPEAILVSEISSPLAWLHGGLAVACSDGVRVFSDDLLELVAHGQFERSLPSETSVSFSDSRKTLLVLHGERLQILGINGGPALADVSIPELDEDAFLLNDQVRAQAIRAGIPILDWESPKLAEAPDRSWFAVKMTGTKTFGEGAKSRTVEDSRLIVIQRSGGSHGLESNSIWRSPIPDELSRMRVSDDGRWCLLHNDHQLFVLDSHSTNSRRALFTKELPLGPIRSVAVSPQAGQLAIAVGDRLDIFNLADGSPITSLNVANPAYLKFSADGRSLLVSSLDGMIRMISIDTNRVTRQWTAVRRNAAFLVADQHEQWLATAGQELALRRWNFLSSEAAGESPIESPVAALQLFEEQKILLAILIDNSISIHAWPNLKRIQRIAPQANTILDACPSQDGKRILVARSDATLIFDTLSGMEVLVVMPSTEPLAAAAILENGRELLQLSRRGHLERHTLHRPVFVGAQRNAN